MRPIISAANLESLAALVDAEEAGHAGELVAVEQDEGAIARDDGQRVDRRVEILGPKLIE